MDPKKLRKQYMRHVSDLHKVMDHVKTQLSDLPPSDFLFESSLKPYTSVKRKMEADGVKDPTSLSDLARGRLFYSEQFNFDDVRNIIEKLFDKNIKNVDDKKPHSLDHGLEYHGVVHIDLDFDGTNFELQIMPLEFRPHKEFLHQIYEKFRNPKTLAKLTDKQKEFLRKVHNKSYKKLSDLSKENRSPKSFDTD